MSKEKKKKLIKSPEREGAWGGKEVQTVLFQGGENQLK